jgi:S1-C subfamily serine protease
VSAGIGFAIPVDTLRYEVDALIRDGRIVRPVIGVSYLDSSQAKVRLHLSVSYVRNSIEEEHWSPG